MWLLKTEGFSGSLSSSLLQAGSTVKSHQAAQNFQFSDCQSGLENLREWRLHSHSEQPVWLLTVFMVKTFLLSVLNLSCFVLCSLSPSFSSPLWRAGLHHLHSLLSIRRLLPSACKAFPCPGWTWCIPPPSPTGQQIQLPLTWWPSAALAPV